MVLTGYQVNLCQARNLPVVHPFVAQDNSGDKNHRRGERDEL